MESIKVRKKVFDIITEFEEALKKMVETKLREAYNIELTSKELKVRYPSTKKYKHVSGGVNIDIAVLSKIVKTDALLFCSYTGTISILYVKY